MAQNNIQFVSQPVVQPVGKARHAAAAGAGTSIALIALALACQGLKPDEGYRARTYLDVASIPTECYGHADRAAKVGTYHSPAQCNALFSHDVSIAEGAVEKCTPALKNRPTQLAAATRLTFNIGVGAYCQSSIARNFNAGNMKAACIDFLEYRFAGGKPVLLARREREEAQCLEGL